MVVAVLVVVGVVVFFLTRGDDDDDSSSDPVDTEVSIEVTDPDETDPSEPPATTGGPDPTASGDIPPPGEEPDGLGSDEALNELAQNCYDGDMGACDDLFFDAEEDSTYESYGDSCAGRQPENTGITCVNAFPDE